MIVLALAGPWLALGFLLVMQHLEKWLDDARPVRRSLVRSHPGPRGGPRSLQDDRPTPGRHGAPSQQDEN